MKPTKHSLPRLNLSVISIALLLIISISSGIMVSSCGPSTSSSTNVCDTAAIMSLKCPECVSTEGNLFGKYLDTLKMSKEDYETLRNTFPSGGAQRSKMVFQFYFNSANGATPSLIAYASKPGNQFTSGLVTDTVARVLVKGGRHTQQLPNIFVFGDQQILFDTIDGIIGTSTNYVILFVPVIEPGEINVRYKICINKSGVITCPSTPPETQPSPPANAS